MQAALGPLDQSDQPRWIHGLANICGVLVIATILSAFAYFQSGDSMQGGSGGSNPLKPSYIYYFVYAVGALIGASQLVKGRLPAVPAVFWFMFVMLAFTLMGAGNYDFSSKLGRILLLRVNYFLVLAAMFIIFGQVTRIDLLVNTTRLVMLAVLVLNIITVFKPSLLHFRLTPYPGRGAGFIFEPNCCALLIATTIPFMSLRAGVTLRVAIYVVALMTIMSTFSRSGFIYWGIAVCLAEFLPAGGGLRLKGSQAALILAIVAVIVVLAPFASDILSGLVDLMKPFLNHDTINRLEGHLTGDSSSTERMYVADLGFEEFKKSPIFGHGAGYASTWSYNVSVHNMLVLMLVEYGVVGLLLLLWFTAALFSMKRPYGIWAGVLFLMTVPFVHYYFDLPCYGVSMALCWAAARNDRTPPRTVRVPLLEAQRLALRRRFGGAVATPAA